MKDFTQIREHTRSLLAAVQPFLAATTVERPMVHVDDGYTSTKEEKCLRDVGYYACVLPILDGDTVSQGAGAAVVDVGIGVRISVNPAKGINVEQLVQTTQRTLLQWQPPVNPVERYKVADKAFVVTYTDPGELSYILFFIKRCVL